MMRNILDLETVIYDEKQDAVVIIDQTLLPARTELIALRTAKEIWEAIYLLKVRGAPAIGVTAALGIYMLSNQIATDDFAIFYAEFKIFTENINKL